MNVEGGRPRRYNITPKDFKSEARFLALVGALDGLEISIVDTEMESTPEKYSRIVKDGLNFLETSANQYPIDVDTAIKARQILLSVPDFIEIRYPDGNLSVAWNEFYAGLPPFAKREISMIFGRVRRSDAIKTIGGLRVAISDEVDIRGIGHGGRRAFLNVTFGPKIE